MGQSALFGRIRWLALMLVMAWSWALRAEDPAGTDGGTFKLAAVTKKALGRIVADEAEIVEVVSPGPKSKAPFKIVLKGGTEPIPIIIWRSMWEKIPITAELKPGRKIYFRAEVTEYKGQLQLSVDDAAQLSLTSVPPPLPSEQSVTEEGIIVSLKSLKSGVVIEMKGEGDATKVFIDRKVADQLPLKKFAKGAKIKVTGTLEKYKEEWELKPKKVEDCVLLAP